MTDVQINHIVQAAHDLVGQLTTSSLARPNGIVTALDKIGNGLFAISESIDKRTELERKKYTREDLDE